MNGILSAAMLKKELELVKAELQLIKDNQLSGEQKVQLSGTYPQHRLLSTDPKPDAATEGKGAYIYEIDTGKVYMSTGAVWQEVS